jgi:hypothetical protein
MAAIFFKYLHIWACDVAFWHHDERRMTVKPDHVLETADVIVIGGGGGETGPPSREQ